MKTSRFREQQIAFVLRQAEEGTAVTEVCRKAGIGVETTTPHQNTHLSMPLKERGFAGRGLILWGIGPCDARVQRGL
jgi:Transposase